MDYAQVNKSCKPWHLFKIADAIYDAVVLEAALKQHQNCLEWFF
ncbi:hypothetical protein COO91_05074 [Nostoc flagelliforme CCNUN1]|uniref:Uncharacterized protein n=1 Tax=Nostoc flagelliforme CCNUN1 TaxID=2038116 RepID=A0A2K8SUE1_9NOSO|nr:hypothetical protein COO91_05074 [Nostoc flagelliforme CCNUN1]